MMGLNSCNGINVHEALIRQRNKAKLKKMLGIERYVSNTMLLNSTHSKIKIRPIN